MALTRPNYNNLNSNVEVFNDPITLLNGGSTSDDDVGFLINRANGLIPNVALYYNESTSSFIAAYTNDSGMINANINIQSYAPISAGALYTSDGVFWANGVPYGTGLAYTDSNVALYLPSYTGNVTASNVTATTITATGNIDLTGTLNGGTIPASTHILYVAKNGSDTNNGSLNKPFLTIQAALAAAPAGTSVHVAPGTYTENNPVTIPQNVSLMGDNLRNVTVIPQNPYADIFYMTNGCYVWGITVKNYHANAFAYSSSTSSQNVYISPYLQNLTSSTVSSTATAVMIDGNFSSSTSTKAMVVGFFTMINQGGVGVHLTNSAYSQLVNIYTIAANVGIWAESGGFCTLNGSDNSIGNIGLRADGYGPLLSYGTTYGDSIGGVFVIQNPSTPPHVNQVVIIDGDPAFYTIDTIVKNNSITYTVTIQEIYPGTLPSGSNITFYQRSEVVASAHTFEYVGAGTNPATALPQYGGYPNANLNAIVTNGGHITYTATDEKGNFFIGANLVINQSTGAITGDSFNKSMFSLMTPYILALAES